MLTDSWTYLKPHKTQREVWECKKRFIGLDCGRGSGKTELAKRRLVLGLLEPKKLRPSRYFYGAPTEGQAKRIAWEHLLRLIPKDWI